MFLLLAILPACVMDSHDVSHLVLGPKRQTIDLDVGHWIRFSFPDEAGTVFIKIPPDFRTFGSTTLPAQSYDAQSRRTLLDAQYDYRSASIEDLAEFEIRMSYIRLAQPVPTDPLNIDALYGALREIEGGRPREEDDPKPAQDAVAGREWMHIDNTASKFIETTCESYGTLVNPQTLFMLNACYSEKMRLKPDWLESRRQVTRQVRDHAAVTPP
jgi:hypothetical protein